MSKRIIRFEEGDQIISRGSHEKRMYIILSGLVEISVNDGIKKVILSRLERNDFFGEISLFTSTPRTADAVARGAVKVTYLDTIEELKIFLRKNPGFSIKMVTVLADRIARTNEILIDEMGGTNTASLVKFFW